MLAVPERFLGEKEPEALEQQREKLVSELANAADKDARGNGRVLDAPAAGGIGFVGPVDLGGGRGQAADRLRLELLRRQAQAVDVADRTDKTACAHPIAASVGDACELQRLDRHGIGLREPAEQRQQERLAHPQA